jgi:hypothetical protein
LASATQNVVSITPAEVAKRRHALESALGSLRIEGTELEPEERDILDRHVRGEIDLATLHAEMDALSDANSSR